MSTSIVKYLGQLRTTAVHLQSNSEVITDAPIDNHGKGEAFSPTDLVATALASCMITVMGIKAEDMGVDLSGTHATIQKHMSVTPRRISEIEVVVNLNKNYDAKSRKLLEATALTCPVGQSLHPETKQTLSFVYPD
jgi:putative redox protein